MLIKCTECGKEMSDKATSCPNCGCPNLYHHCNVNGTDYDFSDIMDKLPRVGDKITDIHPVAIAGMINDKTLLNWESCKNLANIMIRTKSIPSSFKGMIDGNKLKNKPKCPTCQSTNIQKIGGMERGMSVATLGIFSKKINKSFKCNNCGYMW